MSRPQIDVRMLSRGQLEALLVHSDSVIDAIVAANNTLSMKLAETEEMPDGCKAIMDEWSIFLNSALDKSSAEIAAIVMSETRLDS